MSRQKESPKHTTSQNRVSLPKHTTLPKAKEHPFFDQVENTTLRVLRWNRQRRIKKQQKLRKRGALKDWAYAIVSALIFVVLIWHYLFQLYVIPSGSMENTLLVGDRVFVGKTVYGPTLLPGFHQDLPQFPAVRDPARDDVITFRSPDYESPGFFTNLLQKTLFIITFTTVNLQVDEDGQPVSEFYVKRAAAMGGDTVRFVNGRAEIKPAGMNAYMPEGEFRTLANLEDPREHVFTQSMVQRSATSFAEVYTYLTFGISELITTEKGDSLAISADRYSTYAKVAEFFHRLSPDGAITPANHRYPEELGEVAWIHEVTDWHRYEAGIYVPNEYVLPLGDNRHNSLDGRFFGPQKLREIIGITRYVLTPSPRKVY